MNAVCKHGKVARKKFISRLAYNLTNPNYSIYHRGALGGLASTIKAWGRDTPQDIQCQVTDITVEIGWPTSVPDTEALQRILDWSFRLSSDLMIDLPGQRYDGNKHIQVATHYGLLNTFLQNGKVRKCEKVMRQVTLENGGGDVPFYIPYKPVTRYAHQDALSTGLLDDKKHQRFPKRAVITQSMVPGALAGASVLDCAPEDAILLQFLIAASTFFIVRPLDKVEESIACVLIPEVTSLNGFCDYMRAINGRKSGSVRSSKYEGRVVGGSEVAAYRFLNDICKVTKTEASSKNSIYPTCQFITMAKVEWDAHQMNRTAVKRVGLHPLELELFNVLENEYKHCVNIFDKHWKTYLFPPSSLPEIIAANLASDRHWCSGYDQFVRDESCFERVTRNHEFMARFVQSVKNEDDLFIVSTFRDAWALYLARRGIDITTWPGNQQLAKSRIDPELRIVKNAILRLEGEAPVINWFLSFIRMGKPTSDYATIKVFLERRARIRSILLKRNFSDIRSLLLFALTTCATHTHEHDQSPNIQPHTNLKEK